MRVGNDVGQVSDVDLVNLDIVQVIRQTHVDRVLQREIGRNGNSAIHPVGRIVHTLVNHLRARLRYHVPEHCPACERLAWGRVDNGGKAVDLSN